MVSELKALDVVFVIDSTGSMDPYIEEVKRKITEIINRVTNNEYLEPDLRVGVVVYGDHPPEDTILTEYFPLSNDVEEIKKYIKKLPRTGGGDRPEAVADGIFEALNMNWRKHAHKVIILIGDSPPHGYCEYGKDRWPSGCPCGNDPVELAEQALESGITVYAIAVSDYSDTLESFGMIANAGGGQLYVLKDYKELIEEIIKMLRKEVITMSFDEKVYNTIISGKTDPITISGELGVPIEEVTKSIDRLNKRFNICDTIINTRSWGESVSIRAFLKLPGGYKIDIGESPRVVGRGDLVKFVDSESARYISAKHFVIWCEDGKVYIQDGHPYQGKASTNGTFINGEDIRGRGAIQLKNGDLINVAGVVSLSVEIQ